MKMTDEKYKNRIKIIVGIVLGGEIHSYENFAAELATCDFVVCADGGAGHLSRINLLPDLLVGDFDSIDENDLEKLIAAGVPNMKFPPEKNKTDSELAVDAALEFIAGKISDQNSFNKSDVKICLLAATGDRPDHVLANQLMAADMAREGYDVMMSDGISRFYLLEGPVRKTFRTDKFNFTFVVSAIALSDLVTGISYDGLKYPLSNYELNFGSQRGVSNCLDTGDNNKRKEFSVSIESGTLMLIITPDR